MKISRATTLALVMRALVADRSVTAGICLQTWACVFLNMLRAQVAG